MGLIDLLGPNELDMFLAAIAQYVGPHMHAVALRHIDLNTHLRGGVLLNMVPIVLAPWMMVPCRLKLEIKLSREAVSYGMNC